MKTRIKHKNQKLPSHNKVGIEYTNGKMYTIPRATNITVEHGVRIKGETTSSKEGVSLTTQFVVDFTDVDTIEVIGKGEAPVTSMLIEEGVLKEVHNEIKSVCNMDSVVTFVSMRDFGIRVANCYVLGTGHVHI